MNFASVFRIFVISAILMLVGNFVGFGISPLDAIPGMLVLLTLVVIGYAISKAVPIKLPSIAYISALAIIASIPGVPGSEFVVESVRKVEFLAICTPILAYAGISIGKDMETFKKQGAKIVVVSLLAFTGTFIGSALVAHLILRMTGVI